MADNLLETAKKVGSLGNKLVEAPDDVKESLAEKNKNIQEYKESLKPASNAAPKPSTSPKDKINPRS